jgi:hypothetical protein
MRRRALLLAPDALDGAKSQIVPNSPDDFVFLCASPPNLL